MENGTSLSLKKAQIEIDLITFENELRLIKGNLNSGFCSPVWMYSNWLGQSNLWFLFFQTLPFSSFVFKHAIFYLSVMQDMVAMLQQPTITANDACDLLPASKNGIKCTLFSQTWK